MPTQISSPSGRIGCSVLAEQGVEPKIEITVVVGREAMTVTLSGHQAEAFAEGLREDARHALGFDPTAR